MADIPKRRQLRFGLRSLFLFVTFAAVASWLYYDGWENWQIYRQQMAFEAEAKQIKSGTLISHSMSTGDNRTGMGIYRTGNGKKIGYMRYEWPKAFYVIYFPIAPGDEGTLATAKCESVEVYRFPYVDAKYEAKTEQARKEVKRIMAAPHAPTAKVMGYWYDILEYLSGDRRDDLGLKYQLIHADRE